MLGLRPDVAVHDLTAFHRGVECDLTTNEAGSALALLLNGNGNMLERILSPFQLTLTDEVLELQGLARRSVSRLFVRHYAGFFRGCQREHVREATAKTMLYSYRVALTGVHLLRSGVLEPNLTVLAPLFGYHDVAELVALKQAGTEHGPLADDLDQQLYFESWMSTRVAMPATKPSRASAASAAAQRSSSFRHGI